MDPSSSRNLADEGAFDTRIDYDDDLRSETESNRYPEDSSRFSRPGSPSNGEGKRDGEDFGRFEISDGEGDEEYRDQGVSARVLYIHGLSRSCTEKDLKDRFSPHGTVTAVHIPLRLPDRVPKGFGFIRLSSATEATAAIEAENKQTFMGYVLEVTRAKRGDRRGRSFSRSYSRNDMRSDDRHRGSYNNRREYSPGRAPPARYNDRPEYPDGGHRSGPPSRYGPPRDYDRPYDYLERRRDPYPVERTYPPAGPAYDYPPRGGPSYPPRGPPRDYPPGPPPPGYYEDYSRRPGPPAGSRYPPPPGPSYYPAPAPYSDNGRSGPPPARRYDGPPSSYGYDERGPARPPFDNRRPPPPASGNGAPPTRGRSPLPPRY